ncbi:MAG TPA: hypothetical protein DDY78_21960 [Planctomycetales bacterium]|jgi:hypothetical protein|nr:hypothetical protein [Planctomycetales bacterium]
MSGDDATLAVIGALEALGTPYMVVGSFSSNLYGVPRSTQDADFVLQFGPQTIFQLADLLGPPFRFDPQMSFETVTFTMRHVLELPDIPFKVELFHLGDDPYDQERFHRRCRKKMLGREVSVATAEDVIVTKLRWAVQGRRMKDREDARDVIAVQGDAIDWDYVNSWCDRHGSRAVLDEIRASIPPLL